MTADCRPATGYPHRPIIAVAENPASTMWISYFDLPQLPVRLFSNRRSSQSPAILTFRYFIRGISLGLNLSGCSAPQDCLYILRLLLCANSTSWLSAPQQKKWRGFSYPMMTQRASGTRHLREWSRTRSTQEPPTRKLPQNLELPMMARILYLISKRPERLPSGQNYKVCGISTK